MEFILARSKYGEMAANMPNGLGPQDSGIDQSLWLPSEGLVIISEFVSSARVMRGALTINPWRTEDIRTALRRALEMGRSERADRMRRNLEFSTRLTTSNWAVQVIVILQITNIFTHLK